MIYSDAEMFLLRRVAETQTAEDLAALQDILKGRQAQARATIAAREKHDQEKANHRITQNDRDLYRRRCQIAAAVLDEQNIIDLEEIAEVIWPPEHKVQSAAVADWQENFGRPVATDPTQIPSTEPTKLPHLYCVKNPAIPNLHQFALALGQPAATAMRCIHCGELQVDAASAG